jgi:hypothetical protein
MRFQNKIWIPVLFIVLLGIVAYYYRETKPYSLSNVKFLNCVSASHETQKYCFGSINISVFDFKDDYDVNTEELFLTKVDSVIKSVSKNIDRKKYKFFYFEVLNDCQLGCEDNNMYPDFETGVFSNELLNEIGCEDKTIFFGSVHFNKKGQQEFTSMKLKGYPKNRYGEYKKFYRKIDL